MIQRPLSHDEEGLDSVNFTATEAYALGAVEYHEIRQAALLFNRTAFSAGRHLRGASGNGFLTYCRGGRAFESCRLRSLPVSVLSYD